MKLKMESVPVVFVIALFAGIGFFACTQMEDPHYFFTPAAPDSSWTRYDSISLDLESMSGVTLDALFHGKLSDASQLRHLFAPHYKEGQIARLRLKGYVAQQKIMERLQTLANDSVSENTYLRLPNAGLAIFWGEGDTVVTQGKAFSLDMQVRQASGGVVTAVLIAVGENGIWESLPGGPFYDTAFHLSHLTTLLDTGWITVRLQAQVGKVLATTVMRRYRSMSVTTPIPNLPPVLSASDTLFVVSVGDSVTLSAKAVDPDGRLDSFAWDLDGDAVYEKQGRLDAASATLTIKTAATHTGDTRVVLKVVDEAGDADLKAFTLRVP